MAKLGEYGDKLESMTAQEVFNVAAEHLMTQLEKSELESDGPDNICMYNGGEVCCAAAPFIKNYKLYMEHKSWRSLHDAGCVPSIHLDLIESLQEIHDQVPVSEWYDKLSHLASYSGFDNTKLKEFENVRLE